MKIAVIGDVHGFWNHKDTTYFNESDYDALFFVGDLKGGTQKSLNTIIPFLQNLSKPVYFSYGNWDTTNLIQMAGEIWHNPFFARIGSLSHNKRIHKFQEQLPNFHLGMFNLFSLKEFDLIIGRPFSAGGPISFVPILKQLFNIQTLEDSFARYKAIIDKSANENLAFLTHNGPFGLGAKATDIYGCDFLKEEGDWGDKDLQDAISYAKSKGKKVLFVASGHMHHRNPKTKQIRKWLEFVDNTHYANAANVPRIRKAKKGGTSSHHHICVDLNDLKNIKIQEIWIRIKN